MNKRKQGEIVSDAYFDLPAEIADRIESLPSSAGQQLRLGNSLFFVEDRHEGSAVLKTGAGRSADDIRAEAARIDWLQGKLRVPKILSQSVQSEVEYLLMTRLPGHPAHEVLSDFGVKDVVVAFALFLKEIHQTQIAGCPFVDVTEREFGAAVAATQEEKIDRATFFEDVGETPEDILAYLSRNLGIVREDTFTHGDYCLPNLVIESHASVGAVDWGLAGVSDKHRDFMSAELTIRRNFGEVFIPDFYLAYGIDNVDSDRMRFY